MSNLIFKNYSRFIRERHEYRFYAWCVFLDGTRSQLDGIQTIEYVLHPTFPDPVRSSDDRKHCFAIQSEGWGSFSINIRIFLKDGQMQRSQYELSLQENDWPLGQKMEEFPDKKTKLVYMTLLDKKFEWRKLSTIVKRSGLSQDVVIKTLDNLSQDGFARKAYYLSIDNQELWGATSIVGLLPTPPE